MSVCRQAIARRREARQDKRYIGRRKASWVHAARLRKLLERQHLVQMRQRRRK